MLPLCILLAVSFSAFAIEVGETAPDFSLPNLSGEKVALASFKGQPILLKLATTWCPTCKQQSAELGRIKDYLQEKNVAVVEVFVQDSEKMVRDYVAGEGLERNHVVLLDDGTAAKAYNVFVIPRVILIDQNFKVQRDGSLVSGRDLKEKLGQLVSQ